MPSVFLVLAEDHDQVKRLLFELELEPSAAAGASENELALRKKLTGELAIEVARHEAAEERYFWPAVRERIPDGRWLADKAVSQEQESKQILAKLATLDAGDPEFERLLSEFTKGAREHITYEETQVWPPLDAALSEQEAAELGDELEQGKQAASEAGRKAG
jgi:hemerythrin superfamily protein